MKRKNMISMVTSLALVGVVAVGGTLALLSTPSNDVRNTFTVGSGYHTNHQDLTLDEAPVKQVTTGTGIGNYVEDTGDRREENEYNNLVENAVLAKDPQFHIAADCEVATSWVVAKISGVNTNPTATTLKFTDVDDTDLENDAVAGTWYKVTKSGDTYKYEAVSLTNIGNGVYIYDQGLAASESTEDLFQQLQVDTFVAGQSPSAITVTGYAVEGVVGVSFDNMKNDVMKTVDAWAFGA